MLKDLDLNTKSNPTLGQLQALLTTTVRDDMLGEKNYHRIDIGDLVSWKDITENDPEQLGIVLSKWVSIVEGRELCMLKVATTADNQVKNILAIIVKIESKKTT